VLKCGREVESTLTGRRAGEPTSFRGLYSRLLGKNKEETANAFSDNPRKIEEIFHAPGRKKTVHGNQEGRNSDEEKKGRESSIRKIGGSDLLLGNKECF